MKPDICGDVHKNKSSKRICTQCKKKRTTKKYLMCSTCRATARKRHSRRYYELLSSGLCPSCGSKRHPDDGILCATCKRKQRVWLASKPRRINVIAEKQYDRRILDERHSLGVCTRCGRRRDNPKYIQCSRCRQHSKDLRVRRGQQ